VFLLDFSAPWRAGHSLRQAIDQMKKLLRYRAVVGSIELIGRLN